MDTITKITIDPKTALDTADLDGWVVVDGNPTMRTWEVLTRLASHLALPKSLHAVFPFLAPNAETHVTADTAYVRLISLFIFQR